MGWDAELLLWVNQAWQNTLNDWFFAWVSDRKTFSFPLLGLLLAYGVSRCGLPAVRWWLILVLFIFLGDAIGAGLKSLFAQPRPCFSLVAYSHSLQLCGTNLTGMPSNHALNAALVAAFVTLTTRWRRGHVLLWLTAIMVGLSRIYLGKHFPSQVLVGLGLGSLMGVGFAWGVRYLHWQLKY